VRRAAIDRYAIYLPVQQTCSSGFPAASIDVNKRSNKNLKRYKTYKREKKLKTFVNVIKNVTSS